jgi:PHD/YefM family antitoxin component YafN of YafNO toxin-antitoxin module
MARRLTRFGGDTKTWIWDAEFRDTLGATVTSSGSHGHSVFVTATGKRAVVVINKESKKSIMAKVDLPNPGNLVVATPERPDIRSTSGTLHIPARSAAIIMESRK